MHLSSPPYVLRAMLTSFFIISLYYLWKIQVRSVGGHFTHIAVPVTR
jgi:hypothetical protein